MYGSQFHFEQSLNTKRFSTSLLEQNIALPKTKNTKNNLFLIVLTLTTLTLSTIAFAGPSEPRLPGGNGNSRGR